MYSVARKRRNPIAAPLAPMMTLVRSRRPRQAADRTYTRVVNCTRGAMSGTKKRARDKAPKTRARVAVETGKYHFVDSIPMSLMLRHAPEPQIHQVNRRIHGHVTQRLAWNFQCGSQHPGRRRLSVDHPGEKASGLAP